MNIAVSKDTAGLCYKINIIMNLIMKGRKEVKSLQNFWNYRYLLLELVRRDIKKKYRRSALGILWSVLNPLGMMIVMTIVFSNIFRGGIENFPVYLMCGQLIYTFFSEATNMSMTSIIENSTLIKKVYVPKYLFPISRVCSSFVNLLTSCIALSIVVIATRTPLHWTLVLILFPVVYILLFAIGIGMILATLVVNFRDVMHFYGVILTAWMYVTPIFYSTDMLPEQFQIMFVINPLASIIEMLRDVLLYGIIPSGMLHLRCLIPGVISLVIGFVFFEKQQDSFILKI